MSGILTQILMGRLGRLGLNPERRYQHSRPGELLHVDVKKLGWIQVPGHRVRVNPSFGRAARSRKWRLARQAGRPRRCMKAPRSPMP